MKAKNKQIMPRNIVVATIVLLFFLHNSFTFTEKRTQSNIENLVQQSTFIFVGTVTKHHAVTMPIVPVSDSTIVLMVDQILEAPKILGDFAGIEITIKIKSIPVPKIDEQAVFFAKGWLLGEGIAVEEVGRLKKENLKNLLRQIAVARKNIADKILKDRIIIANLIVVGKIASIKEPTKPTEADLITEHYALWQEARLEIEEVLKSDKSLKSISLFFPGTKDVAWIEAPRFKVHQKGIWILQKMEQRDSYTALDPLDFQLMEQLERIKKLIGHSKNLLKKQM